MLNCRIFILELKRFSNYAKVISVILELIQFIYELVSLYSASLDPRPHFPLGKWAWYRLLAHALISPRYLGALDNIVYAQ